MSGHALPSRFCQERNCKTVHSVVGGCYKQCKVLIGAKGSLVSAGEKSNNNKNTTNSRRLTRNRSLVDVRSQLLHRTLVEEVHRRRLSKTVGTVENIGFQNPYGVGEANTSEEKVRKSYSKQARG